MRGTEVVEDMGAGTRPTYIEPSGEPLSVPPHLYSEQTPKTRVAVRSRPRIHAVERRWFKHSLRPAWVIVAIDVP